MKRVAILGGGIAGLAAAYEFEQQRQAGKPVDWHLYEASSRLGGIVQTTRLPAPDGEHGEYILEAGPDAWLTEKPSARELAEELGLSNDIIASNDSGKVTYIWSNGALVPMPDRMRMMVPEDLTTLERSPLFSDAARAAYAGEVERAAELRQGMPTADESVASFVQRHFGEEVLQAIAAPLLSGVFGGDVHKLSTEAVMPAFRRMEAEYGSIILALQAQRRARGSRPPPPTFTSLRRGMGSLAEALVASLPAERLHCRTRATVLVRSPHGAWLVRFEAPDLNPCAIGLVPFDQVLAAVPVGAMRTLLTPLDGEAAALLPAEASSAVLVTFSWHAALARTFEVPPGFGFLIPQRGSVNLKQTDASFGSHVPKLLAGTFTTQKFSDRAPAGSRVIRSFFGGLSADELGGEADAVIVRAAWRELLAVLPQLPAPVPEMTQVARWPRSLPQYAVGHVERISALQRRVQVLGGLELLGNGYRGVGVPDLVRDARAAARKVATSAQNG